MKLHIFWLPFIVLHHLSTLLVKSEEQQLDTFHSIVQCGNPINYLMSKKFIENHPTVSMFSASGMNVVDDYLILLKKCESCSHSLLEMNGHLDIFEAYLRSINSNSGDDHNGDIIFMIPDSIESAMITLNKIGMFNALGPWTSFSRNMDQFYIVWPSVCDAVNCFSEHLKNHLETVPSVSSQVYILHCGRFDQSSSAVSKLNKRATDHMWQLYSIYSVGRDNLTQVRWNQIQWNDDVDTSLFQKRRDFKGATIMAAIPLPGSAHGWSLLYEEGKNGNVVLTNGPVAHIGNYLKDSLNFRFDFVFTKEKLDKTNDSYSDMARSLVANEVDIALVPETFLVIRAGFVTFLQAHHAEGVFGYFRQPPASSIRNIFLESFAKDVWLTLLTVWILVCVSTNLARRMTNYDGRRHDHDHDTRNKRSLVDDQDEGDNEISKDTLLWAIALTCQQGWHESPESVSIRIIFLSASVMAHILYLAYCATLVSKLSMTVIPIKELGDLLKSDFAVTFQPKSKTMEILLNGTEEHQMIGVDQVTLLRRQERPIQSALEGVRLVFDGGASYFSYVNSFYSAAKGPSLSQNESDLCQKISSIPLSKVPFRSGLLAPNNSQYKDFFNQRLVALHENGILRRIQIHSQEFPRGTCEEQQRNYENGLGIMDVVTSYFVILAGHVLSAFILVLEFVQFRRGHMMIRHLTFKDKKSSSIVEGYSRDLMVQLNQWRCTKALKTYY